MAETNFSVNYKGPALEDGRMPVRDLAPALLALGELFTQASTIVYPDRPPVTLDIHATNKGSFDVDLILHALDGAWGATEQLFGSDGVTALVNLKEIILGGSGAYGGSVCLLKLFQLLRGRKIESEEEIAVETSSPTPITAVRLGVEGTTLDVPTDVLSLYKQVNVRRSAHQVVKPLGKDGIDRFEATTEEAVTVSVGKDDLPGFEVIDRPEEEEELQDTKRETTLQIAGIFWGAKWMFTEGTGGSSFYATIEDETFLSDISKGIEAFRQGDLLECELRMQQKKVGSDLKAEYKIVKVKRHIAATEQLNIHQELEAGPEAA